MSNFIPGKVVKKFITKKGTDVIIRYPRWEDIDELTRYINKLSKEDTFILFSGETITKEEEAKAVASWFAKMETGDEVFLVVEKDKKIIAVANVTRNTENKKRSLHVGVLGISVEKEYRGEGIGEEFLKTVISEAQKQIRGLRLIILNVYSENQTAQNLYQKIGFKKCGEIPEMIYFHKRYISEITMYLKLK
jgi:RimJ/RimL family protein N-acetyltransferase